jgi:hypothetical protein
MVRSWFADTTIECSAETVTVRCRSSAKRDRIETHYITDLARAFGVSTDAIRIICKTS